MAKHRKTEKSESMTSTGQSIEETIRARAYEIYLSKGCRDGCDIEDWLEAEREIRGDTVPKVASLSSAAA